MMGGMLYAPAVTNVVGLQWEVFESFIYPLAKCYALTTSLGVRPCE